MLKEVGIAGLIEPSNSGFDVPTGPSGWDAWPRRSPMCGDVGRNGCASDVAGPYRHRGARTVTTMVLGGEGLGCRPRARWRSALTHGGILASLLAVIAALWTVLALVVALLAHPVATMTTLERDGARGVPTI